MKKITLLFAILLTALLANTSTVKAQTQLGTPTAGAASLITAVGFTASWSPADANALSFDVKVYDATPTLVKTVNVTGAATAFAAVTGLTPSTTYTFTVSAKGDGTIYTTSAESTPVSFSTNAFIPLVSPTAGTSSRVTLTGFTANWTAVANATSYDVNIYDASNVLVVGSPKNIAGVASASLAITGTLQPATTYTYTVTAKGDNVVYSNSSESTKSATFTTPASGTFVLQYAASDVALLNTEIKAGAADIYELTTSGGAYAFNTGTTSNNNTMIRSTTIRAAAGLATKPVISLISGTTGSTPNIFYTNTANLTFRFDGLEFSGINTSPSSSQPMFFYAASAAVNTKVYVTNCYLHDFLNAAGNGAFRFDGVSTTQVVDIQGTIFNTYGGRFIYLNAANATTVNLKNNTFSNCTVITSRANLIYASTVNTGTTTIDHCTFYNIATTSSSEGIIRYPSGFGAITVKNSVFSNVAQTLPVATISYCYLAGFTGTVPTGTNTFASVPVYVSPTTAPLDFTITNKSSFVCADASIAGNTIYYPALPKLDTPVVGVATNIGTNGFTANWSAVTNASGGYDVLVYQGTTLVNTTSVVGQSTVSAVVTGLQTAITYTYKVIAKGDALNYNSSDPSVASLSFTTLGLVAPVVGTPTAINTNDFTANWTPVANAIGYNVLLYISNALVSTTNVSGQATSTLQLTGLAMGTTYNYKVVAVGDGTTYLNSDPSLASTVAKTLSVTVASLNPNFGDGTWGPVSPVSPTLGTYPVFSANGWDLTHAQTKTNSSIGPKGEVHSNVLMLDKTTNSGVIVTPTVASVSEIEIHSSATAGRQYVIKSSIDGGTTWIAVGPGNTATPVAGTYYNVSNNLEQIDIITPATTLTNAKFQITDPASGAFTFFQIITRTSASLPALAIPAGTVSVSGTTATGFTANWTNVVPNATGYKVNVYSSKLKTLVSSTTVANPAALTLGITGLLADSTYTVGVAALGDITVYSDGYMLMAALPVITNLAAPVASAASNISTIGFTANWAAVNNASSYDVRVYDATPAQVGTTTNVTAGTLSLDITGLNSGATYTYTVTARGDGALHFDSAPSAPPVAATTTVTGLNSVNGNSYITSNNKTIITSGTGLIQVYNVQGTKVLQAVNTNKVVTALESGIYIVRFTSNDGQLSTAKVIIK